ncbi:hypothetical protein [Ideonella sp. YS5]|uniref:hypothetical protein n=1 Tax=Ideonella sp. YS5 TaxID=3453714 RepID=UPI003EE9331D
MQSTTASRSVQLVALTATWGFLNAAQALDCAKQTAEIVQSSKSPSDALGRLESLRGQCSKDERFAVSFALRLNQAQRIQESELTIAAALPSAGALRDNLVGVRVLNLMSSGESAKAYALAKESSAASPRFAMFYNLMGEIDANSSRWEPAYSNLSTSAALNPDARTLLALASVAYQLKKYEETVERVTQALQLEPGRIASASGLTEGIYALVMLNKRGQALALLRRHVSANPEWEQYEPMRRVANELGVHS